MIKIAIIPIFTYTNYSVYEKNYIIPDCYSYLLVITEAQQFSVSGKVTDKATNDPLYFANIRVLNSSLGTSSNRNGDYELKLKKGDIPINRFVYRIYFRHDIDCS